MKNSVKAILTIAAMACLIPAASFALGNYAQDFELLNMADATALESDGWLIFGNVFDSSGGYLYGYGVFPAPNTGEAFCAIVDGQGGAAQGMQQLSIFNDYNNQDHAAGNLIEANVFQETVIESGDEGVWYFHFDGKMGNLEGSSTAIAFIKTLDPANGYATTNFITQDMTNASMDWNSFVLEINVDASLVGQLLQIGFSSTATNYEGSGIYYDNVFLGMDAVSTDSSTLDAVKALYR